MTVHTITITCADPARVARFWLDLLGYEVVPNHTDSVQTADPAGRGPRLLFAAGSSARGGRALHLDLRPDDQQAEVGRALRLGARRVDIGQSGDESWVVLADPEGNEFCVLQSARDHDELSARDPGTRSPLG